MSFWRVLPDLAKKAANRWNERNAPRLGAALAYYTLLSMAPLSILTVAICSVVLRGNAEYQILERVREIAGPANEETIRMLLQNTHQKSGIVATFIAFATLLFGASGAFVELRDSLNIIWDAPDPQLSGWRSMLRQRLISFAMVLALCLLLLASLLFSAGLSVAEKLFSDLVPVHIAVLSEVANIVVTLLAFTVLFGLVFKFVPNVPIHWEEVSVGAFATAVLFTAGKTLLGWYFATAAVGSTYGAAGSLIALVAWVYYSAQIFFFGAIFTRVYADQCGSTVARSQRKRLRAGSRSDAG